MEKNKNIYSYIYRSIALYKKLTQNCTLIKKEITLPGANVDYNIGK